MTVEEGKIELLKECPSCHSLFITPKNNRYCKFCFKEHKTQKEQEQKAIEYAKWAKQKEMEREQFEEEIKLFDIVDLNDITTRSPLYVIGNGFDLLHGAKSSYYDFADSLGKNNYLIFCLEIYLNVDSIWADFESALGHLNVGMMANSDNLDMNLDMYEAYDEDASAASFYAASEESARPALVIVDDLPKRFRSWVERITVTTDDRPLKNLIKDSPVLCFNYTEFIEDLYGVSHDNVCYIHGCRKKIKYHPKEKLILGHIPGVNDSAYYFNDRWKPRNSYKKQMIEYAREIAIQQISYCDDELTKHCDEIIKRHSDFFNRLDNITDVVVIGHSLSEVDWDYFREINKDGFNWYFSCYGLRDLENIKRFTQAFSISNDKVHIFRLDGIKVNVKDEKIDKTKALTKERILCSKEDINVCEFNGKLNIYEGNKQRYSLIFKRWINKGILFDRFLMVVCDGGVHLLKHDKQWDYVRELEPIPNQNLINRRLDRIMLHNGKLTFIYNSRIRKYRLADGELIENTAVRNARGMELPGEAIRFR